MFCSYGWGEVDRFILAFIKGHIHMLHLTVTEGVEKVNYKRCYAGLPNSFFRERARKAKPACSLSPSDCLL